MTTLREAAQQALEAMEETQRHRAYTQGIPDAITALRAELAQQEQEADYPEEKLQAVAEYISDKYHVWYGVGARDVEEVLRQSARCGLVSGAPRREWQSLTDTDIARVFRAVYGGTRFGPSEKEFAAAIEAMLKEKNA